MTTLTLQLSAATEQVLREKAARAGRSLELYLRDLAERAILEDVHDPAPPAAPAGPELTPEQKAALWRDWCSRQPAYPIIADDSRESIYEGRGE
jgi:plasmid stability protein